MATSLKHVLDSLRDEIATLRGENERLRAELKDRDELIDAKIMETRELLAGLRRELETCHAAMRHAIRYDRVWVAEVEWCDMSRWSWYALLGATLRATGGE